jgi:anti-sigma-K factor RskA
MSTRPAGCGEDVAAYALGALEPEHARVFERHLAECELCAADLAALKPAVAALPESAEPVDPPAELKKRIMAVVEAEAKQRKAAEAPRRERRFGLRFLVPVAAAAAAVVIALVVIGGGGGGGGDTQTLTAATKPAGTNVELKLDDGRGTLVVEGMGAPVGGRVYQVWKQHGKEAPEPTDALFTPTRDGHASVTVPGDMDGVDRVLVSTEPPGGSPRPTTAAAIVVET